MMRFVYPQLLWLLALLPLLLILKGKRGAAPALLFSSTTVARTLALGRKMNAGNVALTFKLLAMAFLIAALARPQQGNTTTEIHASGIDILLAVDVSGSMEAMDFTLRGRSVNRLDAVKDVVAKFIEDRPNDRIGLVAFAGKPYLVSPLTLDHDWLLKRLDSLHIGMIEDGTAIGSAIGTSVNRLRDQEATSRIVILLTDGVNTSGRVPPLIAAEAAQAMQIKVYTIGAGTRGLAPYPVMQGGKRRLVKAQVDIDEETLRKVADKTGALYFRATDTNSLEEIYAEINSMETTIRTIKKFENYRELFPYLLAAVFVLLATSFAVDRNRLP
ncbi:vWA domain-containing protein [Desulfopila inferna]|uniref:vWA domain-containing protein n=1 Tax=Desulfopila inferna TaxID=468528 RepID=UPI001F06A33E|nr:VWA domain-containing protein [Desulfopila inferna]